MASVLGLIGPIAAFGLFYLGDRVFHLNRAHVQTLMYLMLSVAGSLTIFLTRTRGPFWSIAPRRILLFAVLGAEAVATLLAGFGIFMTPLGWKWVAFVWGYALVWFLVTDRVKLLGYRILDPVKDTESTAAAAATVSSPSDAQASAPVAPFHTDTDPDDPVYHDSGDCPYGQAITQHANAIPGRDGRRRCEWCTGNERPAPRSTTTMREAS
jgi:H+-transporting ATPase